VESHSKVCLPKIIKSYKELEEKVDKICESGDKILIKFDVKIKVEELILSYCNLEYSVITNDQIKIIQKRDSANYLICIYEPIK
tara:strand:+ start:442 stop:693 length:252 start_codon:yes stop_codon:yes gene_type:complete